MGQEWNGNKLANADPVTRLELQQIPHQEQFQNIYHTPEKRTPITQRRVIPTISILISAWGTVVLLRKHTARHQRDIWLIYHLLGYPMKDMIMY